MPPVGCLVFKTSGALMKCLVGSTPTSSVPAIPNLGRESNTRALA